jgi:hypothetical protein
VRTRLISHRNGGFSYFDSKKGFSINEGQFPNIHVAWNEVVGFYIAFSHRLKFHRFWTGRAAP